MDKSIASAKHIVKARVKEYSHPPVHDALILGKNSPIGCAALRKAIQLLGASAFEHLEIEDDVISDILIRNTFLRRIPQEKLIDFVCRNVKPLMKADEILHLDLEVEVVVEEQTL